MMNPLELRNTLRYWASGVSVVTTSNGSQRQGMTVSAFNSLSIDPPMILVCLSKDANTAQLIQTTRHFAVNVLGQDHAEISNRFAGRVPNLDKDERFNGIATRTEITGSPILETAIAWLDCRIHQQHDGNTHWIIVGEVLATGQNPSQPLLYFDRDYRRMSQE
jgi:flavin reductase (DIM6/NTAB) family NADH-FMN oxidoreductase RutF